MKDILNNIITAVNSAADHVWAIILVGPIQRTSSTAFLPRFKIRSDWVQRHFSLTGADSACARYLRGNATFVAGSIGLKTQTIRYS